MTPIDRNLAFFFAGSTVSALGTAMVPVALSFAVLGTGRSAGALGLVLAAQTIPTVLLLLLGGVVGDRWSRRAIMIGADGVRCVSQILLASLLASGRASLATIAALTAVVGLGNAFFFPAGGGFVAEITGADRLARANAVLSAGSSAAVIAGPALAAAIVAWTGAASAIGVDGLSYAASVVCLSLVRPARPATRPTPEASVSGAFVPGASVFGDLRLGLGAFAERRWLLLLVGQFGLLNLVALAPFMVLAPVLLSRAPHGAAAWGAVLSAMGVGGVLAAGVIVRKPPQRPASMLQFGVLLLVTPLALLAASLPFAAILFGGICYGAGAAIVNVLIGTTIQREIPAHLLARVFSVVKITACVFVPIGDGLAGPVSASLGPRHALGAGAAFAVASVLVALRRSNDAPPNGIDRPGP